MKGFRNVRRGVKSDLRVKGEVYRGGKTPKMKLKHNIKVLYEGNREVWFQECVRVLKDAFLVGGQGSTIFWGEIIDVRAAADEYE